MFQKRVNKVCCFCVIMLMSSRCFGEQIHRLGVHRETKAALCIQETLGKTILWAEAPELGEHVDEICSRHSERDILEMLKSVGVLHFADSQFIYLQGERSWSFNRPSNPNGEYGWSRVHVTAHAVNFSDICKNFRTPCEFEEDQLSSIRTLTTDDLESVKRAVLAEGPVLPVHEPLGFPPKTAVAEIELTLIADARILSSNGPESVLVLSTENTYSQEGRLFWGYLQTGKFEIRWQSPVMLTRQPSISYVDVNNDGKPEIVIDARDQNPHAEVRHLSILDLNGKDILHGHDCDDFDIHLSPDQLLCPVTSEEGFVYERVPDGTIGITASPIGNARPRQFRIKGGEYHLMTAPSQVRKQKQPRAESR